MTTSYERRKEREKGYAGALSGLAKESPADPSVHLHTVEQLKAMGQAGVIVYERSSLGCKDEDRPGRRARAVAAEMERRGFAVGGVFFDEETGKSTDPEDRPVLCEAIKAAGATGAAVVTSTPSRFLRAAEYLPVGPHQEDLPDDARYLDLLRLAGGVKLAVLHMAKTVKEDEAEIIKLGQSVTRKGGRKPTTRKGKKRVMLPTVTTLRAQGYGYKEIARRVSAHHDIPVSHMTVKRWLQPLETGNDAG